MRRMHLFQCFMRKSTITASTARFSIESKPFHYSIKEGVLTINCQVKHYLEETCLGMISSQRGTTSFPARWDHRAFVTQELQMLLSSRQLSVHTCMTSMSSREPSSKIYWSPAGKVCKHTGASTKQDTCRSWSIAPHSWKTYKQQQTKSTSPKRTRTAGTSREIFNRIVFKVQVAASDCQAAGRPDHHTVEMEYNLLQWMTELLHH